MRFIRIVGVKGWVWVVAILILLPSASYVAGLRMSRVDEGKGPPSTGEGEQSEVWYTCGMHPQVLQREPGNCPICGMKLTPKKQAAEGGTPSSGPQDRKILYWRAPMDPNYIADRPGKSPMGMDLVPVYGDETVSGNLISIDPVTIQNMGIRTQRIRRGPLVKIIRTIGRVDYDEQKVVFVDTKFGGWIEELYVDETGQRVDRGQPLFAVYSPELYSAQEEYLSALRRLPIFKESTSSTAYEDALANVEAGKRKLKYYDVSDDQIDHLAKTGIVEKNLTIHSPADGIVTEKMALRGMQVRPGMRLYTIADLSRVWVYVDIYEYQLPWVHVGQDATMTLPYVPNKVFRGELVYIYPYLEKETRVIKARLEFDNPGLELKPEMFADVMLESKLRSDAILIPREAYIDSGTRKLAFIDRGHGKFEPRDLQVGVEGEGGRVEVVQGLNEGDVVVTSGQFMLDAESKLKEAVAKMMEPRRAPVEPTHAHASAIPDDAKYACPMDKHPDAADPAQRGPYFSAVPGKCPRCGMETKPIDEIAWAQAMKAAQGADVGYTCPDHQSAFSDAPGECHRCGRKLEPFQIMYTCRKEAHAGVIHSSPDDCPECGEPLVGFRGRWLGQAMAAANVPVDGSVAETAAYRCPIHPMVHSDRPGDCTICGSPLEPSETAIAAARPVVIPPDAKYVCPMRKCAYFSATSEACPYCGMDVKPIAEVPWAAALAAGPPPPGGYVCPMHPDKVRRNEPGTCPICAMQLVPAETIVGWVPGPEAVRRQVNFIFEHYLGLQQLLASDSTKDATLHALGMVDSAEQLERELARSDEKQSREFAAAASALHDAALKITGKDISEERARFGALSAAMRKLLEHVRPDTQRWPKLYIYHCPMSQADWIQASEKKANPFYGFKMLDCGKLVETK